MIERYEISEFKKFSELKFGDVFKTEWFGNPNFLMTICKVDYYENEVYPFELGGNVSLNLELFEVVGYREVAKVFISEYQYDVDEDDELIMISNTDIPHSDNLTIKDAYDGMHIYHICDPLMSCSFKYSPYL